MKKQFFILFLIPFFLTACQEKKTEKSFIHYVDPFIGTGGHGHTYPGASSAFGMVQLSPDTRLEGWDGCSGYHYSDEHLYGFSHTHLSGTGVGDYCDILFLPLNNHPSLSAYAGSPQKVHFDKSTEVASPGYYRVRLDEENIEAEFTVSERTGLHHYQFNVNTGSIFIDLKHRDEVLESEFNIISETEVEGMRRSRSWANNQLVYFVASFSKPILQHELFCSGDYDNEGKKVKGKDIKAILNFDLKANKEILIKVGISAVSYDGARKNLMKEAANKGFEDIRKETENIWNKELSKIEIKTNSEEKKRIFYTALYHSFLNPNLFSDVDHGYRGRDFNNHKDAGSRHYTVFSLWDTYRATHPLFTLTQQERTEEILQTFIRQYKEGGLLPVWELAANETYCMIGYHAVPVIADALIKGLGTEDIDLLYEAMKASSMQDHFGLSSYRQQGFIPAEDESESVSKTLEYAYDDWCIAQIAQMMKNDSDYRKYMKRALNYRNIFDPETGFMRAKTNQKWFTPFDPAEVNFNYTEANSWQYSFYVPQDVSGFMELLGGKDSLVAKLDRLFSASSETTGRHQSDITGLIGQYAHGNEPSHHMAYLYSFAGKPYKTQQIVNRILTELYSDQPDGLCGNEDCGQMSSWYVFSAMGFYPVTPGMDYYVIGAPLLDKTTIQLENGKAFIISAKNLSDENIYIQGAFLNGKKYDKAYLNHQDLMNGGKLVFEMGNKPSQWGSQPEHMPVSKLSSSDFVPVPYISAGERSFFDSTIIEMGCIDPDARIYYTMDESHPSEQSFRYTQPLSITKNTVIRAVAIKNNDQSQPIRAEFSKIPDKRKITIESTYANQYSAGGDKALIDFIRGTSNFRTGSWQGYEGNDFQAVLDLGAEQKVKSVKMGFLQDHNSWIFLPKNVSFSYSSDGQHFSRKIEVINDIDVRQEGAFIKEFEAHINASFRYLKIHAENMKICPEWHKGAGSKCWIFADEIVVE
jgi:predicted alpha-1,2-mannosidase